MGMPELEIYSMIGAEGFARLVAAFYRQVPQDEAPPDRSLDIAGTSGALSSRVAAILGKTGSAILGRTICGRDC
jgi:hypothetical protein